MIVIVGNTTGGTGKTTRADQIALAQQIAGRAVLLIDVDRQGSAQNAATMRAEAGRMTPLACVRLADGRQLRAQLSPLAGKHEDTIIDAGGRDSEALRVALLRSDLPVLPIQPRAVDVWALSDIADLIDRAQEAREDEGREQLRVLAVLYLADPGDNRATVDIVEALSGFPQFTRATAIRVAPEGREQQPHSSKAVEKIEQLIDNLFNVPEVVNGNHTAIEAK